MTDGPTIRDCQHIHSRHQHGTNTAYIRDKCRCSPCREAHNAAARALNRRKGYGRDHFTPVGPAREHLRILTESGMSLAQIARLLGKDRQWLARVAGVPGDPRSSTRISVDNEAAILALRCTPLEGLTENGEIDVTGSRRRIRALARIGYPVAWQARYIGVQQSVMDRYSSDRAKRIRVGAARKIAAMYDELQHTPNVGEDRRSRTAASLARFNAESHDWPPPAAWDDIDLDEAPHTGESRSNSTPLDDVRHLLNSGVSTYDIAERLNSSFSRINGAIRSRGDEMLYRMWRERRADDNETRKVA